MSVTATGSIAFNVSLIDEIRPDQVSVEIPPLETPQDDLAKAVVVIDSCEYEAVLQAEPMHRVSEDASSLCEPSSPPLPPPKEQELESIPVEAQEE